MTVALTQVDAFAERPFEGNPAAVVVFDDPDGWPRPDAWMQAVAGEVNLSETAFLRPVGRDRWHLRWFTPTTEVDLCGHATLASAFVLAEEGWLATGATVTFETRSGDLQARVAADGWIGLDLPADPAQPTEPAPALLDALGLDPADVVAAARGRMALVQVRDAGTVRALAPDMARLAALEPHAAVVTAPGDDGVHAIASRMFAPAIGIDEDPVTGAAHCLLATHWAPRLGTGTFLARQVSARGGTLRLALDGERVGVAGRAVTVLRAELLT